MNPLIIIGLSAMVFILIAVVVKGQDRRAESTVIEASGPAYFGVSEIESHVGANITEIGRQMFPDNRDVTWSVHGFEHRPGLVLAEVTPEPDTVGYSRFKFGFSSEGGSRPEHVATYRLEDGAYLLLSTSRSAPSDLPQRLN
jgi:hypothetical protein